jgi:hypothetical protein
LEKLHIGGFKSEEQIRKEMDVLTQYECTAFLNALQGERLARMFSFA